MTPDDDKLDLQKQTASAKSQDTTSHDQALQLSQEEMQRRYLEQQRRLACPGCAEEPFLD